MVKIKTDDFSVFVKECKKWIDIFGMYDWEFKFVPASPEDENDELGERRFKAWVTFDSEAALAVVYFNTKWREYEEIELSEEDIKLTAFHEVCEILLADIMRLVHARMNVCEEDVNLVKHKLIHRFEEVIFKRSLNDTKRIQK
jgi:hypothetical protein